MRRERELEWRDESADFMEKLHREDRLWRDSSRTADGRCPHCGSSGTARASSVVDEWRFSGARNLPLVLAWCTSDQCLEGIKCGRGYLRSVENVQCGDLI